MAEIKNSFLRSKMNKDLDDRLIPNGEYRDAQNISVGKSEADDIGALETVLGNAEKAKKMIKSIINNFESHIDPKDPTNNCLDIAIITAPEKRTQKTIDKLKTVAGRALSK